LVGGRLGGGLNCYGAASRNDSGPALAADGLEVGQGMLLPGRFTTTGAGDEVAVDLRRTQVGGVFALAPGRLEDPNPRRRLAVDGLTFAGVPETSPPWD
jgi:hypothetical protein